VISGNPIIKNAIFRLRDTTINNLEKLTLINQKLNKKVKQTSIL
jgi:hypothetical protein